MSGQLKDRLDRNIWITRKCRINASERLLNNAKFLDFINVYFSIFTILLSIFSLDPSKFSETMINSDKLPLFSLAISVVLTISIVYASSLGYRDRSAALKQNYIALQSLLDRLAVTDKEDDENLLIISDEYTDLLDAVENHLEIDMLNLMRHGSVPNHTMTISDQWRWFFYCVRQLVFRFLLIAAPICCLLYLFMPMR